MSVNLSKDFEMVVEKISPIKMDSIMMVNGSMINLKEMVL